MTSARAPGESGGSPEATLRALLAGEALSVLLASVESGVADLLPDHVAVVAPRAGTGRVATRSLPHPRSLLLALDRAASSLRSDRPGLRPAVLGASGAADLASAPWSGTAPALADAGLGAPVLFPLVDAGEPLGLLAVIPPAGTEPDLAGLAEAVAPWATVAAMVLARAADRSRLRRASLEDDSSGLPRRSEVMARLREALHRRPRRPLALLHVQLTGLRDVVGEGRPGTDAEAVLRQVGDRVRTVVRPGDEVGDLGGGSLAIICDGATVDEAVQVGERVVAVLAPPLRLGPDDLRCRPTVGVVAATDADTVNSLGHKAALAAQDAGSGASLDVVRYRPGTYEAAVARADLERDLRRAVDDDGLHLAYQPQVSLLDGALIGAEALVRWDSPRGPLGPDEFIPLAERSGLVVDLGRWAIDTAVEALASEITTIPVSVNVSARQLDDERLVEVVASALARHDVDPSRLCLEITESALVRDVERSGALLRALHASGVRISIDDFGTGYASLEALRQIDVADTLKIDRTFVEGIVEDARDRAIVAASVTLGRNLGFTVVAEGVETAAQAELLAELGCDAAQGYWFGEPVEAAALLGAVRTEPSTPAD